MKIQIVPLQNPYLIPWDAVVHLYFKKSYNKFKVMMKYFFSGKCFSPKYNLLIDSIPFCELKGTSFFTT